MSKSYIQEVALELAGLLKCKNQDYASVDEFSNFVQSALFAGIKTDEVMMAQLAIKWSRLENLFTGREPVNESIEDNLMDLAGYAIILAAFRRACKGMDDSVEQGTAEGYM